MNLDDINQCPYCELRFLNESELEQHIAIDHPNRSTGDTDGV